MEQILCPWEPSTFLFFSSNVPNLVHYSHALALLAALATGLYVYFYSPKALLSKLFLALISTFSAWIILDLILWATNRPDVVMFSWSLQILLEPMTYAIAFYLFYYFLYNELPSFRTNMLVFLLFVPILSLLPTSYNIDELYLSTCEVTEGFIAKYYTHIVHATLILSIAILCVRRIPKLKTGAEKFAVLLFGFGLITFLLSFSSGTIIGSLTDDWALSQYGLFGMPIFAAFVAYSVVRYKAFNSKILTAELLVVAVSIAVISLVALQSIQNVRIVAGITFLLVCALGYLLVRNVRREIKQRELIEKQEKDLELINKEQENLLHFISHEVKGYLTKSEAGFAAITEETFGPISPDLKKMSSMALSEMRKGVATVMDILNASDLKRGSVSYAKRQFDFKRTMESVVEDLKISAEEKNLRIEVKIEESHYMVNGDEDKIRLHAIRNLVDNAIKYTPANGSIRITLSNLGDEKIRFTVEDSGVGITSEDMQRLFTEGGHGKDSLKVNAHSTGYGLYIAKKIVDAHGGKIWAESEGAGKGSRFIVELPKQ